MSHYHSQLLRSQIIGTIVLVIAVFITFAGVGLKRHYCSMDTAETLDSIGNNEPSIRLHRFDPNTVDSIELIELGFPAWQAHSFLKYRQKGKRWYRAEQLRTLYGMTDSMYDALKPYIAIDTMPFHLEREERQARRRLRDSLFRDSVKHYWDSVHQHQDTTLIFPHHPKKDTILDLNTADTASLQYIRGIGRFTAIQIIRYRERLGGYVSPEQLHDLAREDKRLATLDTLTDSFTASLDSVRTIPINHTSISRLAAHPYISYTQAEEIYTFRRSRHLFRSKEDLTLLSSFSSDSLILRVCPYLSFDP